MPKRIMLCVPRSLLQEKAKFIAALEAVSDGPSHWDPVEMILD